MRPSELLLNVTSSGSGALRSAARPTLIFELVHPGNVRAFLPRPGLPQLSPGDLGRLISVERKRQIEAENAERPA